MGEIQDANEGKKEHEEEEKHAEKEKHAENEHCVEEGGLSAERNGNNILSAAL